MEIVIVTNTIDCLPIITDPFFLASGTRPSFWGLVILFFREAAPWPQEETLK